MRMSRHSTHQKTTNKYYFDASEKNVSAVKAKRAAYDALVSNYGYADLNTNGITYTSAAGNEALLLAAEHNQGADAAYDVKDTKKLQAYLNNATLKVTTKALGNSKIRVNARFDAETYKDIVAECGNDYTISYKFYQKSAKATSFKGPKEKSRNYITYTKASLKKGTKYKFQCGVVIKDAQGNVVAEKSYKASTTGSRICRQQKPESSIKLIKLRPPKDFPREVFVINKCILLMYDLVNYIIAKCKPFSVLRFYLFTASGVPLVM